MNIQVTLSLKIFNLGSDISAEKLSKQIESEIEPHIHKIIQKHATHGKWIYELETYLKENIELSDNVKEVFKANNIPINE